MDRAAYRAEHRQPETAEMCRDPAGPAPDVGDGPRSGRLHEVGEPAEQRAIQRLSRQLVTEPLGVVVR